MRPSLVFLASSLSVGVTASVSFRVPSTPEGDEPGLTFQTDPSSLPALSFETWSDVQNTFSGYLHQTQTSRVVASAPPELDTRQSPELSDALRTWRDAPAPGVFGSRFQAIRDAIGVIINLTLPGREQFAGHYDLPDFRQYTIGQVLDWALHNTPKPSESSNPHALPLYRLAWLVNRSEPVQAILNDPNAGITLFAPDDDALTPPSKRKPHHHRSSFEIFDQDASPVDPMSLADQHPFWEALESWQSHDDASATTDEPDTKNAIFLKVLQAVLKYHISPQKRSIDELLDHVTIPTKLPIAYEDSAPKFRIRIGAPHDLLKLGQVTLNCFSRIGGAGSRPIITKNGIIHIVRRFPLLPPFSPLTQTFLFPKQFSTWTSGIQKVHLDKLLLPTFDNKTHTGLEVDEVDPRVQGILADIINEQGFSIHKRSFTVFAPTNRAFSKLGVNLNAFLFSPFGYHVLKYILSYHVVPDIIWHSDHVDNVTDRNLRITNQQVGVDFPDEYTQSSYLDHAQIDLHPHAPKPLHPKVDKTDISLPTLLGSRKNETLNLCLVEFKSPAKGHLVRRVYVKQPAPKKGTHEAKCHDIPVIISDIPAWGGAVHVVPSIIHPPVPEGYKHKKEWIETLRMLSQSL